MRQRQGGEPPEDDAQARDVDAKRNTPPQEGRERDAERHGGRGQGRESEVHTPGAGHSDVEQTPDGMKRAEVEAR